MIKKIIAIVLSFLTFTSMVFAIQTPKVISKSVHVHSVKSVSDKNKMFSVSTSQTITHKVSEAQLEAQIANLQKLLDTKKAELATLQKEHNLSN